MKRFHLGNGVIAFKWHNRYDPRGYVPPKKQSAEASLIEHHPVTGKFLGESQWWMFLTTKGIP